MNVVDSSGWLAYFAGDDNADYFAAPIEQTAGLIVPALSIYEVFKRILQQRNEGQALEAVALMQQGRIVSLDQNIALLSARISNDHKLALADSTMLATARFYRATLWTQDADFESFPEVRFKQK